MTIGIVDDHQLVRESLVALIDTFEAHEVILTAESGATLFKQINANKPDLLLLDIQMPEMDGIEVCRRMKQDYPEIKVMMLSMHANSDMLYQVIEAGADGYLTKQPLRMSG